MATSRTKVMLGDAEVADIVNSRKMKGAGPALAKKYGVSVNRIREIWKAYYGGTTLADAANGPIKPLPGCQSPAPLLASLASLASPLPATPGAPARAGSRTAGKFVATAPPTYVKAGTGVKPEGSGARAKPVRIIAPAKTKASPSLRARGADASYRGLAPYGGAPLERASPPPEPRGELAPPSAQELKALRREMGSLKAGNDSTELADAVQERLWRFAKSGELSPEEYTADEREAEEAYEANTQFTNAPDEGEDDGGDGAGSRADEVSTSYELSADVEPRGRIDSRPLAGPPPPDSEGGAGHLGRSGRDSGSRGSVGSWTETDIEGSDYGGRRPGRAKETRANGRAEGSAAPPRGRARAAAPATRARARARGGPGAAGARGSSARSEVPGEGEGDYGGGGATGQPAPIRSVHYPIPAAGRRLSAPAQEPLPEHLRPPAGARPVRGGPGPRGPPGARGPNRPTVPAESGRGARVPVGPGAAADRPLARLYASGAAAPWPEEICGGPTVVQARAEKEERKRVHNGPSWLRGRPA